MKHEFSRMPLEVEFLEPRLMLSLTFYTEGIDHDHAASHDHAHDHAHDHGAHVSTDHLHVGEMGPGNGGGGGRPGGDSGPQIDLLTVAIHEFGHSLGLAHSDSSACSDSFHPIMCPFYNGPQTNLHPEDIASIRAAYDAGGNGWDDPNITYSFMPDNARMDQGKNSLFKTMNSAFGSEAVWQQLFAEALDVWAAADNRLSFSEVSDNGARFNSNGAVQGDSNFGDIRIGSHRFDGSSGTLAHAYFPPPNGATAAGDAHFDNGENWVDFRANLQTEGSGEHGNSGHGNGNASLVHVNVNDVHDDDAITPQVLNFIQSSQSTELNQTTEPTFSVVPQTEHQPVNVQTNDHFIAVVDSDDFVIVDFDLAISENSNSDSNPNDIHTQPISVTNFDRERVLA